MKSKGNEIHSNLANFGHEIEAILAKATEYEWTELLYQFREIEEKTTSQFEDHAMEILEIRRRTAESIFLASTIKKCTFDIIKQQFDEISQLGFSNLEVKYHYCLTFASSCLTYRQCMEGLQVLRALLEEIKEAAKANVVNRVFAEQVIVNVETSINELEQCISR